MTQCTAHRSSQPDTQCRSAAIIGGRVCAKHGGSAPQVRAKALERLAALVDPAITRLGELMAKADTDAVTMRAIGDILDRAGFRPIDQLKLSGDAEAPLEIIITRAPAPTSDV